MIVLALGDCKNSAPVDLLQMSFMYPRLVTQRATREWPRLREMPAQPELNVMRTSRVKPGNPAKKPQFWPHLKTPNFHTHRRP
jgi:hypothetical protein